MRMGEVASISNASVPPRARKCLPDAAPGLRRTIRDNKHCAPNKNERGHPRRASPQEDTSASQTNWPTATVRQFKRGPQPDFTPTSHSLPADEGEHGPSNSEYDSRAETARARGPHSKQARSESRQRQLKGMETQKGPSAQLHSTSGVVSIDSPGGESGAEKPIEHLSKTSLDKSGLHDSDPEQQSQIQSNKQEQLLKRNP